MPTPHDDLPSCGADRLKCGLLLPRDGEVSALPLPLPDAGGDVQQLSETPPTHQGSTVSTGQVSIIIGHFSDCLDH